MQNLPKHAFVVKGHKYLSQDKKRPVHKSVTNYLEQLQAADPVNYPEISDEKAINYYVFEVKTESYLKNGKQVEYKRTARLAKNENVCKIVEQLKLSRDEYLKHRSHVTNVNTVLPVITDAFNGKYIELDFSENLAMKPKYEVQSAHFSGKQFCLHCAIVHPGDIKYEYHLSDDTTHDYVFVKKVLEDIFLDRGIKNEAVIIKSDNAPTKQKQVCF